MGENESFFGHNTGIPVGGGGGGGEGRVGPWGWRYEPQADQKIVTGGRVLRNNYYLEGFFHTVASFCNSYYVIWNWGMLVFSTTSNNTVLIRLTALGAY